MNLIARSLCNSHRLYVLDGSVDFSMNLIFELLATIVTNQESDRRTNILYKRGHFIEYCDADGKLEYFLGA